MGFFFFTLRHESMQFINIYLSLLISFELKEIFNFEITSNYFIQNMTHPKKIQTIKVIVCDTLFLKYLSVSQAARNTSP